MLMRCCVLFRAAPAGPYPGSLKQPHSAQSRDARASPSNGSNYASSASRATSSNVGPQSAR